eukprot:2052271-Pyramimonas_sp.AAC.1
MRASAACETRRGLPSGHGHHGRMGRARLRSRPLRARACARCRGRSDVPTSAKQPSESPPH